MNTATAASAWAAALARGVDMKRAMLRMAGGALSTEEAALRLDVCSSELDEMSLFWLEVEGERVYPAFQFAEDGFLPGIASIVEAFAVDDPWMRVNFMLTGDARLSHRKPIDLLREGQINEVVSAARAYGEHSAA